MSDTPKLYPYQQRIVDAVKPRSGDTITARLPRQSGATELACHLARDPRFERVGIYAHGSSRARLISQRLGAARTDKWRVLDTTGGAQFLEGHTWDLVILDGADRFLPSMLRSHVEPCLVGTNGPLLKLYSYRLEELVVSVDDVVRDHGAAYEETKDSFHLNYEFHVKRYLVDV